MTDTTERKMTKIAREAEKLVLQEMKDNGIGSGEIDLIHYVRHHPGSSLSEVAQGIPMDKAAVTRRSMRLVRKGYLVRKPNPDDHRGTLLYPTELARQLKLSKVSVETVFYGWLTEDLSAEQKETFLTVLNELYLRSKKESRAGFPHVKQLLEEDDPHVE